MTIEKVNKSVKSDLKEKLKKVFPQIFEDNKINFEKLKTLLSEEIIEKEDDRFYFNWAGKSNIYKVIQSPAYGTLKLNKERSVDFDKTENIVIVGENLETLKLLLKPYFGKVKMIYIDPPYNTGKDRIYRDNFKEPLRDYLEKTGQIDSEGKKLTTNTEASGRYHSDWLNFMYPRLFLEKSLLREDGVIFISIDDNEVHHLRMIMDEIFGENNFVGILKWKRKKQPSFLHGHFAAIMEYILIYAKNEMHLEKLSLEKIKGSNKPVINAGNKISELIFRKGVRVKAKVEYIKEGKYKNRNIEVEFLDSVKVENRRLEKDLKIRAPFRTTQKEIDRFAESDVLFITENFGLRRDITLEETEKKKMITDLLLDWGQNQDATKEIREIFGKDVIDNPKPSKLIKNLIKCLNSDKVLILDFFAGSGTTGQAVWDLNKEDGGNRKFILVQLDEEVLNREIKKEFATIADICIERLKRVSEKYKKDNEVRLIKNNQDFGFKVFKLDKSNFNLKDEFKIPEGENVEELKKKYLEWLGMWVNEPLVPGWKEIDIVYETLLKEGLNLNSKIAEVKIKNNKFYYVKDKEQYLDFYICLENKVEAATVEEIRTSKFKDKKFIFLDEALADNDKINLSTFVRLKVI